MLVGICKSASMYMHAGTGDAIIPGSMCAALFPAIIGTAFPGALYLSQTLKFRNPALVRRDNRHHVMIRKAETSEHRSAWCIAACTLPNSVPLGRFDVCRACYVI